MYFGGMILFYVYLDRSLFSLFEYWIRLILIILVDGEFIFLDVILLFVLESDYFLLGGK